jgi:hypothetical protein
MILTMWKRMDDYMVMYLKIGKNNDSLENHLTRTYAPLLWMRDLGKESKVYKEISGVKP